MRIQTNASYIFDQLTLLLERISDGQYAVLLPVFSGASVGKHYRHIIEFFQSVSVSNQTEMICYDNRLRNEGMEKDRILAMQLLNALKEELAEIDPEKMLTLIGDLGSEENGSSLYMHTSLLREFHYSVEHAIHHMAIIKMGMKQAFPQIEIPQNFGVAPSTIRHQKSIGQTMS